MRIGRLEIRLTRKTTEEELKAKFKKLFDLAVAEGAGHSWEFLAELRDKYDKFFGDIKPDYKRSESEKECAICGEKGICTFITESQPPYYCPTCHREITAEEVGGWDICDSCLDKYPEKIAFGTYPSLYTSPSDGELGRSSFSRAEAIMELRQKHHRLFKVI